MDAGLRGLHRIVLIVDGRSRAGEIVDLVHLDIERKGHVVTNELEARVAEQMRDVGLGAGEEIVDANDIVALSKEPVTKVRTEESGPASNENGLV